jgi:hypothetical protein
MQDENQSTSPDASTPNTRSDAPRNAFHPDFLKSRQDHEDEPLAAVEAESRGPWIVVEPPAPPRGTGASQGYPERYEVYRSWEDPETDSPAATFRFREQAFSLRRGAGGGSPGLGAHGEP